MGIWSIPRLVMVMLVAGIGAVLVLAVTMTMFIFSDANQQGLGACTPQQEAVLAGQGGDQALDKVQRRNAATIVRVGQVMQMPRRAVVVALAVAHQESRFLNYANDGTGDLDPTQLAIGASLNHPHDAVGHDHGSLGVFQQQWPWWGSIEELMDPATAARKFYQALRKVPGWEAMSITAAGQAVQKSAYPDAYADDVALAETILSGADAAAPALMAPVTADSLDRDCVETAAFTGRVVFPLPPSAGYVDLQNWHNRGGSWVREHTGTDLSAACGTPVLAATGGTVIVKTDQPWSGRWLVQISTGPGQLATWYGHMQALTVEHGQVVQAGQQIGEAGSEGNSTGCHLHFEVHPRGGSLYEDDVDPSKWLAQHVGRDLPGTTPVVSATEEAYATLLTANVPFTLSPHRARQQIRYLLSEEPDVLLLQEVHNRNLRAIAAAAPGQWGVWQPGAGSKGSTAIIWNTERFSLLARGTRLGFAGPDYDRWLVWAILQSDDMTLPVVALHMPPNAGTSGQARRQYRTMSRNAEQLLVELKTKGYPAVAGGDWNYSLVRPRQAWSPVRMLRRIGYATNWHAEPPCAGTGPGGGRIDGFAVELTSIGIAAHGCLPRRHSDHRPVWIAIGPPSSA